MSERREETPRTWAVSILAKPMTEGEDIQEMVRFDFARRLERSRRRNILRVVKLRRKCELYRAELSRLLDILGKTDYDIVLDFLNKIETEG